MTDAARTEQNRRKLQECYPGFRVPLASVLARLQASGYRPRVQCAWRSVADQEAAYHAGTSHVTYGFHNTTDPQGIPEALAADVLDDDRPLNPTRDYLLTLARLAGEQRLETGILWSLPANSQVALTAVLATHQDWLGPIGFDPCHVEVTGVTILEAKVGRRPSLPGTSRTVSV